MLTISFILIFIVFTLIGCARPTVPAANNLRAERPTLVLADAGWDSIQFHNAVVQYILENGFGYKTEVISGSTAITFAGLVRGDIDIYTEIWTTNLGDMYTNALKNKEIFELGINFDDNAQGLYVPTFIIKGDPARGINPSAPTLRSIKDLPRYWELFRDPENPSKGRIYGSIPGWESDAILVEKFKNYGLDRYFTYFNPGSDTALAASLVRAYESGEPWVGYYWEPTWVMGKKDMTLLADEPFSYELWNDGFRCEFPPVPVTIAVHRGMMEKAPEVVEFLKNYRTSSALINMALAYMRENEATAADTAKWFLKEHLDLWTAWVPSDAADKVKTSLNL